MTLPNALTLDAANDALTSLGLRAGSGASSMIEQAETLFTFAEVFTTKHGKEAAREAYTVYATANNAGDTRRARQIDLGNDKSLKAQISKFNVFIKLGSVERTQRHDFISQCCAIWENYEVAKGKPSLYDAILRAARAQIEAGARLSGEDICEAMFPLRDAPTRVSGLEALAGNLAKHIEKWAEDAIPGSHALHALDHLVKALADAKKTALN